MVKINQQSRKDFFLFSVCVFSTFTIRYFPNSPTVMKKANLIFRKPTRLIQILTFQLKFTYILVLNLNSYPLSCNWFLLFQEKIQRLLQNFRFPNLPQISTRKQNEYRVIIYNFFSISYSIQKWQLSNGFWGNKQRKKKSISYFFWMIYFAILMFLRELE